MSRNRSENIESKLYVGDLPRDAEEKELERAFGHYGPIKNIWVARNPPGFAFVEFEDARDAEDAVRGLDGSSICGVRARVEHATGKSRSKPWDRRDGGRGPPPRYGGGGGAPQRRTFNPDDRCFTCNERGHYSYDCPQSGGKSSKSGQRRRSPSRSRSRSPRRQRSHSRSASRSRSRGRSPRRSGSRGSKTE